MSKHKRSLLESVAKEMNEIMQLTPAIELTMSDDDTLLATICNEATGNGVPKDAIRADDTFTAEAWALFIHEGVWNAVTKCIITPKPDQSTKKPAPAAQPELPLEEEKEKEGKVDTTAATPAKAAAKKAAPAKAAAKKAAPAKAAKAPKTNLDTYGFREDSMSSKAMELFTTGKFTMAEAMKKVGSSTDFNYALGKIKKAGKHKITVAEDGKITLK